MQRKQRIEKEALREQARIRRAAVDRRTERSAAICRRLMELPEWKSAQTIALYVDFRDEVQTAELFAAAWQEGKGVAVPWCRPDVSLDLYAIESLAELVPGKFGILEPPQALREDPARAVPPAAVDLIVIPGLAFDRAGGRMGYGRGHYDRLISQLRTDCCRAGIAFDAQIIDRVPTEEHDAPMQLVVTETAIFQTADLAQHL